MNVKRAPKTTPQGGPAASTLFDEWIRASQGVRAAGTLQWYAATSARWVAAIGDLSITEIDSAAMERFAQVLAHTDMAPATIRIYFRTLRTFLHWCARRGHLDRVPAAPRIERDERLPVTLTDGGVTRLLAHLRDLRGRARAHSRRRLYQLHERFVLALLATGARRSELFYLRWEQFDFGEGLVRIKRQQHVFRVKEGREKVVPLPGWAVDWFSQEHLTHPAEVYLLDEPYVQPGGTTGHRIAYADPYQLTHAIRRHLDRLGLRAKGLKPIHGFRAKMIDDLYKAEVDILTIQRRAGHAKIETTRGYIATPDAHARAAAEKLDDRWRISAGREAGS